ncbi:MAG: hypothetical protein WB676_14980 [Bryobacteraceae bacterium]
MAQTQERLKTPLRGKTGRSGKLDRATRGLVLPGNALARLRVAGILGRPEISVEFQRASRTYVMRGVESGGAIADLGRYITFASTDGKPLAWLQPVDSLAPNGAHAFVISTSMLRAEVFRVGRTYDAIVTRHVFSEPPEGARPAIVSDVVFAGAAGYLGLDLPGRDQKLAGTVLPEFFTRGGELLPIPEEVKDVLSAAVKGSVCLECTHSHFLVPSIRRRPLDSPTALPDGNHTSGT